MKNTFNIKKNRGLGIEIVLVILSAIILHWLWKEWLSEAFRIATEMKFIHSIGIITLLKFIQYNSNRAFPNKKSKLEND